MQEILKKESDFAVLRREFLKVGLAGGLLAGIPMGMIPKLAGRKAYAAVVRGADVVAKIPAETRWTITAQGLTGAYVATIKAMLDAVGREKFDEIMTYIWTEGGKSTKQIADALSLTGHDAKSAAEATRLVIIASMGPEFEFEVIEATAEKALFRWHQCQWCNRMKELEIPDDLCSAGCNTYWDSSVKSFNPQLTASLNKSMPLGAPYCEHVVTLQKQG